MHFGGLPIFFLSKDNANAMPASYVIVCMRFYLTAPWSLADHRVF
jgi:hypothetical protein